MMCIALYNSNYNFECNCNLKYSWAQPDWTPPQICALLPDFSPTCWTPHFWFASTMSLFSQPMVFLMILDQSEVSTGSRDQLSSNHSSPAPPDVVLHVGADLELEGGEALRHELVAQPHDFLLRVTEPARRRGVSRQS